MRQAAGGPGALLLLVTLGAALAPAAGAQLEAAGLYTYHTPATLQADLERLALEHPEQARLGSIGRSVLGLDLWMLEIGNLGQPGYEALPALFLDGGHHGNEHLGVEAAYLFARGLLEGYGSDPEATALVDQHRVFVVPLVNPDGKLLNTRTNANLVNLNRNYPWHWDERGTGSLGDPNYAGPAEASEPETQAIMAELERIRPAVYATLHTGTYDVVRPFGHAPDEPLPDEDVYQAFLGWAAAEQGLESRWPGGSGESLCWAYGALGIFSLLFEVWEPGLRPGGTPQLLPGPLTHAEVDAALAPHLASFRHLLAHAPRWGAFLEAAVVDVRGAEATLVVRNAGFGPARNLSVAATGLDLLAPLPAELAPGAEARAPVRLDGPSHALVRYQRLAVPTPDPARAMGQAEAILEVTTASIEPRAVPGPGPLVALAAALLAGLVLARTRGNRGA